VAFLLEVDPDLGMLVPSERIAEARRSLQVAVQWLPVGIWDASRLAHADPGHLGLLIVDGVLSYDVLLEDCISTELLGAGDLVRPWHAESVRPMLRYAQRWNVLADAEVAFLDRRLAAALGRYPEVYAALLDRLDQRSERLAAAKAIGQLNRVDRRLVAFFWHLADRWGRVTAEGVVIPLAISHRTLANLIGARRPTVSTSLGRLAREGWLTRRPDGSWLLTGEPSGAASQDVLQFVAPRRRFVSQETVGLRRDQSERAADSLRDA